MMWQIVYADGVVTEAVSREQLDERVYGMADRLAKGATRAIRGTKMAINALLRSQLEMLVDTHLALETETYHSKDHSEAAHAFLEKRKPAFTGE